MRILVTDDDPVMRHILDGYLTQYDHDVILAEDGEKALALFKEDPFLHHPYPKAGKPDAPLPLLQKDPERPQRMASTG